MSVPPSSPPDGREGFPTTTGSTPSKFWTKNKLIAGGVASILGVVAVGAGAYFGVKSAANEQIEKLSNGYTTGQDYEGYTDTSDPAEMSIEQFESLSRVQQMDYAGTKLNDSLQADRVAIIDQLNDMGWGDYNYFNRDVVKPDITNTPQQIWDQITLGDFKVWKTAQQGDAESIKEAKKLATAVCEGQEYDELVDILGNGGAPVVPVGAAEAIHPAIASGEYEGVDANGLGVIEFKKTDVFDGDQVRIIARLTKGQDDNSMRWVIVKVVALNQSGQ